MSDSKLDRSCRTYSSSAHTKLNMKFSGSTHAREESLYMSMGRGKTVEIPAGQRRYRARPSTSVTRSFRHAEVQSPATQHIAMTVTYTRRDNTKAHTVRRDLPLTTPARSCAARRLLFQSIEASGAYALLRRLAHGGRCAAPPRRSSQAHVQAGRDSCVAACCVIRAHTFKKLQKQYGENSACKRLHK